MPESFTPSNAFLTLSQAIEKALDRHDGGCFFNVLRTVQASMGRIEAVRGLVDEAVYQESMASLLAIVESLPEMRTEEAVEAAFEGLRSVPLLALMFES